MHHQPVCAVIICWTGDDEDADAILAPIRRVAQPLLDMVQPMPYTALQSMLDAGGPHGINAYMKADLISELDDEVVAKLANHGAKRAGPMAQLILEPLGGAVGRVGEHETALGRREGPGGHHALAMWTEPTPEAGDAHTTWARELSADLAPHTTPGVYLNFTPDEGRTRCARPTAPRSTSGSSRSRTATTPATSSGSIRTSGPRPAPDAGRG